MLHCLIFHYLLQRFDTVREQPSTSNGNAHPATSAALNPPSPIERMHSPGDFIVAQEETTTTHILHDMDEPPRNLMPAILPVVAPVQHQQQQQQAPPPPQPIQTRTVVPEPQPQHIEEEEEEEEEEPSPEPVIIPAVPAPAPVVEPAPLPAVVPIPVPARAPTPRAPVAEPVQAPPAAAVPDREHEALMSRYADALAEIARLQGELSAAAIAAQQQPVGVRRRTTTRVVSEDGDTINDGASDDGTAVDTMEKGPQAEGVPINIVAGIALAVFLATYLFF